MVQAQHSVYTRNSANANASSNTSTTIVNTAPPATTATIPPNAPAPSSPPLASPLPNNQADKMQREPNDMAQPSLLSLFLDGVMSERMQQHEYRPASDKLSCAPAVVSPIRSCHPRKAQSPFLDEHRRPAYQIVMDNAKTHHACTECLHHVSQTVWPHMETTADDDDDAQLRLAAHDSPHAGHHQ
uniref:Uncharacterized protein n=2 Tax=Craspedostauros australis TaxID=1486917 RepID=A0A7R9WT12_9STRA|mmetsp:Transcript_19429/g.54035  ORF Transcript_19429/g.54035 Transcript_19429/m.54035 type:complete len:185 (+) Transcript_19429:1736-2290(+)